MKAADSGEERSAMSNRTVLPGSYLLTDDPQVGPAPAASVMALTLLLRRRTPLDGSATAPAAPYPDSAAFAAKYGMTDEGLATVRAFAQENSLVVGVVDRGACSVRVSGTVQKIQVAFDVLIRLFRGADGEVYLSNDADASLPSDLDGAIQNVLGLSERPIASPRLSAVMAP
jgi:hypothetical protein